jgi:small-conductance mechanosensitive channel
MDPQYRIDWTYIRDTIVPDINSGATRRVLLTLGVIVLLFILQNLARRVAEPLMKSRRGRYYWGKSATYLLLCISAWCLMRIWFAGIHSLATFIGLFSAGMAIALKDPLVNFAGFFMILFRRPFKIGQRIQIGEFAGDVIDIRSLHFTLLEVSKWSEGGQSTGRLAHIPNGLLFTIPLVNYQGGFDFLWSELTVTPPPGTDWREMRQKLLEIVSRHAETDESEVHRQIDNLAGELLIRFQNLQPIVYVALDHNRPQLTARYLCRTRRRRDTESHVWEELLEAYPQLTETR